MQFRFTLRVAYFEDYLLIRRLSYGPAATDELYVVRPPYRLVDDSERTRLTASVNPPDFTSRFSIFYVYMPQAHADHQLYVLVNKARTGDSAISFERVDEGFLMKISPEVFARIGAHMRSHLDLHANGAP